MTSIHIRESSDYYPKFDWLRGVLALTVMWGHEGLIPWEQSGNFAVKVFFALSGWLIGGLLLKTSRGDLERFYFNRAVRIWAPYYLALSLLLLASLLHDRVTEKWLEVVFYKLTFVYNWFGTNQLAANSSQMPLQGTGNHFWSVNAEEQFYLLAPLLLLFAPARIGRSALGWFALAAVAWWFRQYASIAIGVTAAIVAHAHPNVFSRAWARIALGLIGTASVLALVIGITYELIAPIAAICIVLLLATPGRRTALGTIVGGMSYPLYLNHWIGFFVANALLRPLGLRGSLGAHVLSTAVNLSLALALYWFVDRRLLARRGALYTVARAKLATRTAYVMVIVGLIGGFMMLPSVSG